MNDRIRTVLRYQSQLLLPRSYKPGRKWVLRPSTRVGLVFTPAKPGSDAPRSGLRPYEFGTLRSPNRTETS